MPVPLSSGARSSGISFDMLHRTDKSRLKQQNIFVRRRASSSIVLTWSRATVSARMNTS